MKFAKIVFYIAFVWGILILTPLYFMFNTIGEKDPSPITHPAFYYGFVGAGLAWQFAFLVIARDPVRFRMMMLPSILEKFGYAASLSILYLQGRLHGTDLGFGGIDALFGVLFIIAFLRTPAKSLSS
jgi:vacuolar-type H+-ATPase subunit I/STV1